MCVNTDNVRTKSTLFSVTRADVSSSSHVWATANVN